MLALAVVRWFFILPVRASAPLGGGKRGFVRVSGSRAKWTMSPLCQLRRGEGVRGGGEGRIEPGVGVALVDKGGVDVEDDSADRSGRGPAVAHVGTLRGIQ